MRAEDPNGFKQKFERIATVTAPEGSARYTVSPNSTAMDQTEENFAKLKGKTAVPQVPQDDNVEDLLQQSVNQLKAMKAKKAQTVTDAMK